MLIACTSDENFAEITGVFLRSLALNGEVADARVVLVADGLSPQSTRDLHKCADGLNFRMLDLAESKHIIADLPAGAFTIGTFVRLILTELFPDSGRALYLDTDILVNRPIRPLFDIDLEGSLLAAVEDYGLEISMATTRLGRPPGSLYVNAGVMLFDLDEWRRLGIGRQCIKVAQARKDHWPDQDAINLVLDGRIKILDRKWNFYSRVPLGREEFAQAHIVHFIPNKPSPQWRHQMRDAYMAVRATTPWRDRPVGAVADAERMRRLLKLASDRAKRHKSVT